MTPEVIDTSLRGALKRMADRGRIVTWTDKTSPHLELASIMKANDGDKALLFPSVDGHAVPIIGNLLSSAANCEAAFGTDFRTIREFVGRAISGPIAPEQVDNAPVQDVVITENIDLGTILPVLQHAPTDGGRFITSGIVIVKDPGTGVYNASYHRLHLQGGARTGIKLDYGRHLRLAYEHAQKSGQPLAVAISIGTDLALQFTAATMGSQMPPEADELAVAGGLKGEALKVTKAITQDILVPAESEFILEGYIHPSDEVDEGPFGEFVGFQAPMAPSPVFTATAVTHRKRPIYHAINGFGRETIMLRKYVLEASLLKILKPAVPIVTDAEMTAGGLHRFHAVIQVKKGSVQHEGLQRNAILAAFGALKDLDYAIVVDDDIDIRNPQDVEYALATRMEASRDLIVIPGARGHEYVRIGNNGIRAKLGIDATVPFEEKPRFARVEFAPTSTDAERFGTDPSAALGALKLDDE